MNRRLFFIAAAAFVAMLGVNAKVQAAEPMKVSASFSILGDMVKQVGGDRVEVFTFVGPNGDAHVYEPTSGRRQGTIGVKNSLHQRSRS